MADVKWIKIVTDIFDDEKILLIESLPSADAIIVIWFKLLCFAGKNNNHGVFMLSDRLAYTDEMLATIFRRSLNTIRTALKTFEEFGMIEMINNTITIPNWDKHQTLDSYEKKKERDRLYQAERREKQKLLANGKKSSDKSLDSSSDVAVSDKEKEKDIDKDIDKKEKKKKETDFDIIINQYTTNEELKNNIYEFIKMRKGIKAAITSTGLTRMLSQLDKFADNDTDKMAILDKSIMNSWRGIFELKEGDKVNGFSKQNTKGQGQYKKSYGEGLEEGIGLNVDDL